LKNKYSFGEMHIFISKVVNQMRIYNFNELNVPKLLLTSNNSVNLGKVQVNDDNKGTCSLFS
jgi:hypothetical protein